MSTKLKKETVRPKFRPANRVFQIAQVDRDDTNYLYKEVIFNYTGPQQGLERVDRYLEKGWEVVVSTDTVNDDRSLLAAENKEGNTRPKEVTGVTSDGKHWVLLRILKTKFQENQKDKAQKDFDRFQNSIKGRKTTKKGNTVSIDDGIIGFNK